MLEEGQVKLADMRSSWGGAMGLTQFLPSEFYKYAVDFDHDGRRDIWNSVPDALASAAKQLVDKGWQPGLRWAYEVHAPKDVDCTQAIPDVTRPVGAWLKSGYVPAYRRVPTAAELAAPASLLLPEGTYGPAFLTLANYYVIKEYNFSDLYVLFVGHLSERITDPRPFETPWSKNAQLHTGEVEAMQRTLTRLGIYKDKIDGKAGMLTRSALGAYQKANGLKADCWPTAALLAHMQAAAGIEPPARIAPQKTRRRSRARRVGFSGGPAAMPGALNGWLTDRPGRAVRASRRYCHTDHRPVAGSNSSPVR